MRKWICEECCYCDIYRLYKGAKEYAFWCYKLKKPANAYGQCNEFIDDYGVRNDLDGSNGR